MASQEAQISFYLGFRIPKGFLLFLDVLLDVLGYFCHNVWRQDGAAPFRGKDEVVCVTAHRDKSFRGPLAKTGGFLIKVSGKFSERLISRAASGSQIAFGSLTAHLIHRHRLGHKRLQRATQCSPF